MTPHPAPKTFLPSLQVLRGLAAGLVVLVHAGASYKRLLRRPFLGGGWEFGAAGVDVFFVLSGFVLFHAHGSEVARPDRLASYARKRFVRIYPLYWVVLLFRVLLLLAPYGVADRASGPDLVKALVLWPVPEPVVSVSWTLSHEVFFYAVFAALIGLPRRASVLLAGAWLGATLAYHLLGGRGAGPDAGVAFVLSPHNVEFALGVVAAVLLRRCGSAPGRAALAAGAVAFALTCAFTPAVPGLGRCALLGISSCLVVLGAAALDRDLRPSWPRALTFLGDASYSIYLVHATFLFNAVRLGRNRRLHGAFLNPAVMLALVALAVAVGCAFHLLVERPLLAFFRGRLGARRAALSPLLPGP